jgi:hypothetical protein
MKDGKPVAQGVHVTLLALMATDSGTGVCEDWERRAQEQTRAQYGWAEEAVCVQTSVHTGQPQSLSMRLCMWYVEVHHNTKAKICRAEWLSHSEKVPAQLRYPPLLFRALQPGSSVGTETL